MYRVKVHLVGKSKELWLQEAEKEYLKRLSTAMQIEVVLHKTEKKLEASLSGQKELVLLDPQGTLYSSLELADALEQLLHKGGSRLEVAIGGAEGFSSSFKKNFAKISFSPLTFTHQISRLLLWEQLYRCTEIWKGSGYHK